MTLTPEQEAIVEDSVRQGQYPSSSEALTAALHLIQQEESVTAEEKERREQINSKTLFELMQESPFRGLDIEFPRDRSPMRDLEL